MEDYKIHIEQNLPEDYSAILKEYWEIKDNDFCNKPSQICAKFNITKSELNRIIRTHSFCNIIYGYCSDCGEVIEDRVYSQTRFKEKKGIYAKERCDNCESIYYRELEAERVRQQELEIELIEKEFIKAIQEERWNSLTDEEYEILRGIVRIKNKSLIYKEVFNDNPFDKSIWKKVRNIENLGLLFVRRDSYQRVIEFLFPEQLEQKLLGEDKAIINEELNFLSFSLSKNINKTNIRQPDYSGTFILKRPVRLESNVKYIYGGWINTDGSINLKIQPLDNIVQKVEQGSVDNEPTHIKGIINDFFNNIEENDLDE